MGWVNTEHEAETKISGNKIIDSNPFWHERGCGPVL